MEHCHVLDVRICVGLVYKSNRVDGRSFNRFNADGGRVIGDVADALCEFILKPAKSFPSYVDTTN